MHTPRAVSRGGGGFPVGRPGCGRAGPAIDIRLPITPQARDEVGQGIRTAGSAHRVTPLLRVQIARLSYWSRSG